MNIDGSNTVLSLGQVTYLFGFNVMIVFSDTIREKGFKFFHSFYKVFIIVVC